MPQNPAVKPAQTLPLTGLLRGQGPHLVISKYSGFQALQGNGGLYVYAPALAPHGDGGGGDQQREGGPINSASDAEHLSPLCSSS